LLEPQIAARPHSTTLCGFGRTAADQLSTGDDGRTYREQAAPVRIEHAFTS
jgi:hypothetical protein